MSKLTHSTRVNEEIIVRLKWGQTEYKGRLISVDSYMNIQLSNTEELVDGKSGGSLGQVLIRYAQGYLQRSRHILDVGHIEIPVLIEDDVGVTMFFGYQPPKE